jgi:hypothetical protein
MKKGKTGTRIARRDNGRSNAKIAARKARQRAAYDHKGYDGHGEAVEV